MKKAVLVLSLAFSAFMVNAQQNEFEIKQAISNEPDTELKREACWGTMVENILNGMCQYDLQLVKRILKPNGKILSEEIVHYSTSSAKKYKFTSATTWVKINSENPNWNDSTYVPEYKFFFNLMNKTIKPMTDEQLKKAIISNLDKVDCIFDK